MSSEEVPPADAADAADMAEERVLDLTDPKAMRALAHPVRMALLELLAMAPTLTATQASEALGESPANCAFHLRTLARYGYLTEAGGGKGRERPWKLAHKSIHLTTHHDDAATASTARTLNEFWLDRVLQRARQILTSADELPEGWRGAEEASQTFSFLTADEVREVARRVNSEMDRYKGRHEDQSLRPPGSLPVEMVFLAYPLARMAELASGETFDESPEQ